MKQFTFVQRNLTYVFPFTHGSEKLSDRAKFAINASSHSGMLCCVPLLSTHDFSEIKTKANVKVRMFPVARVYSVGVKTVRASRTHNYALCPVSKAPYPIITSGPRLFNNASSTTKLTQYLMRCRLMRMVKWENAEVEVAYLTLLPGIRTEEETA
jgi:hypothetical protein